MQQPEKKTAIITSFHTLISRNILQTPIIGLLQKSGFDIVIAVPNFKVPYFEKTFKRLGVTIEGFEIGAPTRTKRVGMLKRLAEALPDSRRAELGRKLTLSGQTKSRLYYYLFYYPVHFLGKSHLIMQFLRLIDYWLSPRGRFYDLFEKYKPALVFSTDVQNEHDVAIMQDAKSKKIPVLGMVRSWDNVVTRAFRFVPKRILIHNAIIGEQANSLYGIDKKRFVVTGVPHYDAYLENSKPDRNQKFKEWQLASLKKTVLFFPLCDYRVVRESNEKQIYMDKLILETLQAFDCNVIVRFPPNETVSIPGFDKPANFFYDRPGVGFDAAGVTTREIRKEDDESLRAELSLADAVVCGPSTAIIDAALFDKPIVCIDFEIGKKDSLHGFIFEYQSEHIVSVLRTKGIARVKTVEELKTALTAYFKDPSRDQAGRRQVVNEQCYKTDRLSSKRVALEILEFLTPNPKP